MLCRFPAAAAPQQISLLLILVRQIDRLFVTLFHGLFILDFIRRDRVVNPCRFAGFTSLHQFCDAFLQMLCKQVLTLEIQLHVKYTEGLEI